MSPCGIEEFGQIWEIQTKRRKNDVNKPLTSNVIGYIWETQANNTNIFYISTNSLLSGDRHIMQNLILTQDLIVHT